MEIISQITEIYQQQKKKLGSWKKANRFFGWAAGSGYRDLSKQQQIAITPQLIKGLNELGYTIALVPYEEKESDTKSLNDVVKAAKKAGMTYGKYVQTFCIK